MSRPVERVIRSSSSLANAPHRAGTPQLRMAMSTLGSPTAHRHRRFRIGASLVNRIERWEP
jgi:hypothetical protein